jgi:hypothetical protein
VRVLEQFHPLLMHYHSVGQFLSWHGFCGWLKRRTDGFCFLGLSVS